MPDPRHQKLAQVLIHLREGKVYADGQLCYENGRFKI